MSEPETWFFTAFVTCVLNKLILTLSEWMGYNESNNRGYNRRPNFVLISYFS